MPCNYIHAEVEDIGDTVAPECDIDPEHQFDYLSTSIQLNLLHNRVKLSPSDFEEKKFIYESAIQQQ